MASQHIYTDRSKAKVWLAGRQEALRRVEEHSANRAEKATAHAVREVLIELAAHVNESAVLSRAQQERVDGAAMIIAEMPPGNDRTFRSFEIATYINTCAD